MCGIGWTKEELRKDYLAQRRSLSPEQVLTSSATIVKKVISHHWFRKAQLILFYEAQDKEVNLQPAIQYGLLHHKKCVFPKVVGQTLLLFRVAHPSFGLELGRFDILEPTNESSPIDKMDLDLILVPGIVFDERGYRIGYGGGYYDRLLQNLNVPKIGLAYEFQILRQKAEIPYDYYDAKVDMIITEKKVISCSL